MKFYWEIIFCSFPTHSFVKGSGVASSVPVIVNCEGVLQGCMNWETSCLGYNSVVFQYSICIDNNSISPQMSSKYSRSRGDFVEVHNRMVYYSI